MCSPEIKQSLIALSAFNRLGEPSSIEAVLFSMNEIAKETGAASFDSIGDYTSNVALGEFANESLVELHGEDKFSLTERGERVRVFQAGYVRKHLPNFPVI